MNWRINFLLFPVNIIKNKFIIRTGKGLLIIYTLLYFGCSSSETDSIEMVTSEEHYDPHSFSKPDSAVITHMELDLTVDFENNILSGHVQYDIINNKAEQILFDVKQLVIEKVTIGEQEREVLYTISEPDSIMGSALSIPIAPLTKRIKIYYTTTPQSEALQWVMPVQTALGNLPFLYTQGQPILTRTWIPIQDSPGIRFTYRATIRTAPEYLALMSAINPTEKSKDGIYQFEMNHPVPAYLVSLAVGDLQFQSLGPRCGVYAELPLLKKAEYEFGDTEKMMQMSEGLYGAYLWDRYDILVLPPSYPFGGMENPMLTFATPTILAGDRSLTALVAHELAHSWSGNLVTNANWNNLWLNEGFTVYFERRIMEALYGKELVNMLDLLSYSNLNKLIVRLGKDHPDTHLLLDLQGRDPDEGMTRIAYDKGYFFLKMLEEQVGRRTFDAFLKQYFEDFKFKSIATDQFMVYLDKKLITPNKLKVNVDEWVYGAGLPSNCPVPVSDRFDKVEKQYKDFFAKNDFRKLNTSEWTAQEWLHFLSLIPLQTDEEKMRELDRQFNLSNSTNAEIQSAWYQLAIKNGYADHIMDKIETFLIEVGRRKFLVPIYTALVETERQTEARRIYAKARSNYHSISSNTIDGLLHR